jgi:hypothetical protein
MKAITRNYSEVENEQLEIKVGAEHGKIPSEPYIKTIKEIVNPEEE